jgi:positive regulator of sigma E activity
MHAIDIPEYRLLAAFVLFIALLLYFSLYFTALTTIVWIVIIVALAYLIVQKYYEGIYLENQKRIDLKIRFLDQMIETL